MSSTFGFGGSDGTNDNNNNSNNNDELDGHRQCQAPHRQDFIALLPSSVINISMAIIECVFISIHMCLSFILDVIRIV